LFNGIDSLQEVYGTPVLATQAQLALLKVLVYCLLAGVKVQREPLRFAQIANFALTGGLVFRQTRADLRSHGRAEAAAWTTLEDVLTALTR